MQERNTVQKQTIYSALCALDHPTATEVYGYVHQSSPSISRGTVFRVLNGFSESGKIRKLQLSDSDVRYDMTTAPHFHARCRICGAVKDVFLENAEKVLSSAKGEDILLDGVEAEFFGICTRCASAQNK